MEHLQRKVDLEQVDAKRLQQEMLGNREQILTGRPKESTWVFLGLRYLKTGLTLKRGRQSGEEEKKRIQDSPDYQQAKD